MAHSMRYVRSILAQRAPREHPAAAAGPASHVQEHFAIEGL